MKLKDFELGVTSYCEKRVAPALPSSLDRWVLFAGLAVAGAKFEGFIQKIIPTAAAIGLIDGEGDVNLDLLEQVGYAAFEKQPKVEIWKLTFIREDFSDFLRHLRGQN